LKRDLSSLTARKFDVIIVGGGIFGVCIAWDAAMRGLSVALVEKGDFSNATSMNHFRMIHGGVRYLQHGDIYRVRESSRERSILLHIAPHLIHPLPFVIPTYGHRMKGKEILGLGLWLYDLITADRNIGIQDRKLQIPKSYIISKEECKGLFPNLDTRGLTGAAIFYDGQVYNPARLALAYVKSAVSVGAQVANYLEATKILIKGGSVTGIQVRDINSGVIFELYGKIIVNASGPWAVQFLEQSLDLQFKPEPSFSRDAFLIIKRKLTEQYALALQSRSKDADAMMNRGGRHLFIIPWQEFSLLGVWHVYHPGGPDDFKVTKEEIQGFVNEINENYPHVDLSVKDVSQCVAGLILFGEESKQEKDKISFGKRSMIIDHAREHNLDGLVTVIGVRFTTSRGIAEKTVDLVFKKLGKTPPKSKTAIIPIHGGLFNYFDELVAEATKQFTSGIQIGSLLSLLHNHGSAYKEILKSIHNDPSLTETIGSSKVLKAEVLFAIREEMALRLDDVVLRRTNLGAGGHPGDDELRICADIMASELKWDSRRIANEISAFNAKFPKY
jgi:glycerol-3-phosphate dehydrogenase